jgi:hypothetical protein
MALIFGDDALFADNDPAECFNTGLALVGCQFLTNF